MSECKVCGMHTDSPTEYHPYAVCLMMLGARSIGKGSDTVRANLDALGDHFWKQGYEAAAKENSRE